MLCSGRLQRLHGRFENRVRVGRVAVRGAQIGDSGLGDPGPLENGRQKRPARTLPEQQLAVGQQIDRSQIGCAHTAPFLVICVQRLSFGYPSRRSIAPAVASGCGNATIAMP